MTSLVMRALELPGGRGIHLFERNVMSHRRTWPIIVSGFFEPLFYLLSLGYGLGGYVGDVVIDGQTIEYAAFVAPALLAASAFNGAFYDATNIFWKLRYQKVYDAVLATPLGPKDIASGETAFALFRGLIYAVGFFTVIAALGLLESWWALLAVPATVFIGFAFAGAGIAAVTYMRSWQDFDILNLAILPMFLFSATFFPLSTYPDWLEWVIRATPLYNGVELLRALTTGTVGADAARQRRLPERPRPRRHVDREPAGRKTAAHVGASFRSELCLSVHGVCGQAAAGRGGAVPRMRQGIRETERSGNADHESRLPRLRLPRLAAEPDADHGSVAASPLRRGSPAAPFVPIRLTPPK